jgi:DNA-binding NarL/FixJ family response regulator
MSNPIRIVIVDDHPLFREGVARTLGESGRFTVVAEGGSADDAVRLAAELDPDLVLLDLSMPGGGISAAVRIAAETPSKVVVLTVSEASDDIMAALKAGAKGYVLKGVGSQALIDILSGIANGESYVSPSLAARLLTEMRDRPPPEVADDPLSKLTDREEQILRLVARGMSNKEVGRELDLQEKTVKHHMTRILEKLHVRNRTEAALLLRDPARRG